MSSVYVISDLHLGHKNILNFSSQYRNWADDVIHHDHILIERIKQTCKKKTDILYILGDVAFDEISLFYLKEVSCRKILIRGNHDEFSDDLYKEVFESIQGFIKYKNFWLSHCPIHPLELRGKINIHGHVHSESIRNHYTNELDNNYINACVENCNGFPIRITDITNNIFEGVIK